MRNNKKKTDMNKKRYTAPQMKIKKVVTQGFLTISNPNITRGQVITDDDGEYDESGNPSFDSNGRVFGD